jgi:hypothetical protein
LFPKSSDFQKRISGLSCLEGIQPKPPRRRSPLFSPVRTVYVKWSNSRWLTQEMTLFLTG